MMKLLHARFARRLARVVGARDDDRGVALATVIIFGAVLLLMSATVVSVSASGSTKTSSDANWVAAGQAAYAGVEDYQSKLANDNAYSQYGSTGPAFSAGSSFISSNNNPAFGYGSKGATNTWAQVDPTITGGATYRYAVNNSQYSSHGILQLQSTGRAGNTTRTVVANLKQSGFLDYLYFTDYEIADPALTTGCAPSNGTAVPYEWQGGRSSNCTTINFAPVDTIKGPAFSNDTMQICGATFNGVVSTASTHSGQYILPSGCSAPNFTAQPSSSLKNPVKVPVIQMPTTIGKLVQETRTDLTGSTVPRPGCLYTGPTTFTFNGDGTMTVYSPWTQFTNYTGDPATTGDNSQAAMCGTAGSSANGNTLGSPAKGNKPAGQTIPTIPNNLVYVQNVPSSGPNSVSAGTASSFLSAGIPKNYSCKGADGTTAGNGVGFPGVGETAPSTSSYSCTNGDAFVTDSYDSNGIDSGGFGGNMTIAANNYLYVTGDVTYDTPTTDLLGLIGENNVVVYNPVGPRASTYTCYNPPSNTCTTTRTALLDETKSNRTIDAAVMSVLHSFTVQNYSADSGYPKGTLNVVGSIVQKYRGTVATSSGSNYTIVSGYTKNYSYDQRLAFEAPPKFLSPVSTTYGITSMTESKTAMSATGDPLP
ncbi:hypothetical protein [Frondihabitans cladoniiphilus]|uniref:Flp pilus-assembly TadE/G-like protein n=1 Tax=Frondihabitans cladoniiphilus TaxID=715785 RepID=A0ABP8VY14_9MICO